VQKELENTSKRSLYFSNIVSKNNLIIISNWLYLTCSLFFYSIFMTKIALITGGSRGLGKNMALHLAKDGVDSIITYNTNQEAANQTVSELQALWVKAVALQFDASRPETIAEFVSQIKTTLTQHWQRSDLDILINNAWIGANISFMQATQEQFDEFNNIHFKSVYFLTQGIAPIMCDGWRIIMVSTGTTRFVIPTYSIYASMKWAIETLTKYLAKEFGPRQITVNCLAPGGVETDFNGGVLRDNPDLNKMIAGMTAMGRPWQPDDIWPIVAFLCSDGGRWVTAQRIEASGWMVL
jgi:NAD(P)-dependent dehydrogenase (short-subunit alcohol dehydrogenase family)